MSFSLKIINVSATMDKFPTGTVSRATGISEVQKSKLLKDTQFIAKIIPVVECILKVYYQGLRDRIPAEEVHENLYGVAVMMAITMFPHVSSSERAMISSTALAVTNVLINTIPDLKENFQQITSRL